MMEFHIARTVRERYQFAESLFSFTGNVVFANMTACRDFAYRMNQVRDVEKHPELAVHAGKLFAMGLIDEVSHVLMARYREQYDPECMTSALEWFGEKVGTRELDTMLLTFVKQFPGQSVLRGLETPAQWLAGESDGVQHRAAALEELLLLWMANRNPAFKPFSELFEDSRLAEKTVYRQVTQQLPEYFATRPLIPLADAKPMSLLALLSAPLDSSPDSLSEQLQLIRKLWKPLIGTSLERFLQMAGEILHEEELAIWMQFNPPAAQARAAADEAARLRGERGEQPAGGPVATAQVPTFGDPAHEYEKFSPDTAWMPTAVLIAKSTYVWLAQLSRKYSRHIGRLDEIPDEDLAELAERGINTLWLIGVWERSRASKTIKLLCGNTDAVASAYSLFDYSIAGDLGGEAAYTALRDRAFHHGVRLASDMVPNHMGIDSPWVVEHPEWFIGRDQSPYPSYSFNGPDLSSDARVELKIDDHYYTQTDAAVVFRRVDKATGATRFIYHGNDGTSFPWNDTAQLDYLNPAVREQVIQTILHVARLFPVIRFDAAMTLAKRHFHRLWFPGPGASGAIPSRAEYGMSQQEFDQAMPHEFWREVVDRVAAEVPGTLLLAEAFWLMEGYFVRTLGMHRVYNSAFMVMLRDEDNAKYRSVLKNTIEFDPDILKRYVNFMSNPDERTAIDQFGKGDKCFGVAVMMSTLPGLPMFGHGQIEGFTEKYGMEYRWPRYQEDPDRWLVERHQREVAPLLKRRWLFAESANFLLYDFYLPSGAVDENVFAYSNRSGTESALVVYNNRYGSSQGSIDHSAAYADKAAGELCRRRLAEGLGLSGDRSAILAYRDSISGLEYLRRAASVLDNGFAFDLHAYQCHVFLDWRELQPTAEEPWDRLCDQLNGRGVPDLHDALVNLELQPVHAALCRALDPAVVRLLADAADASATPAVKKQEAERLFLDEAWARVSQLLRIAPAIYARRGGQLPGGQVSPMLLAPSFRIRLGAVLRLPALEALFPAPWTSAARRMLPSRSPQLAATAVWGPIFGWCVLISLAEAVDAADPDAAALDLFDRLRLREPFAEAFTALGFEGEDAWRVAARIKVLLLSDADLEIPELEPTTEASPDQPHFPDETFECVEPEPDVPEIINIEALERELGLDREPYEEPVPQPNSAPPPVGDKVALAPALRCDPDVRWLTGVHEAEDHIYLVRERYEELLWWLLIPALLHLAAAPKADCAAIAELSHTVAEALATAEAAGYRVDELLGEPDKEESDPTPAEAQPAVESPEFKPETPAGVTDGSDPEQPTVPDDPETPSGGSDSIPPEV
ncbi:MAG: alpha-amylase family glycosyl hydrolase [Terracidiphilus sp.]|nr:alpha-amylase family glycosyl hydrolase [Terracidiphilus sp.]